MKIYQCQHNIYQNRLSFVRCDSSPPRSPVPGGVPCVHNLCYTCPSVVVVWQCNGSQTTYGSQWHVLWSRQDNSVHRIPVENCQHLNLVIKIKSQTLRLMITFVTKSTFTPCYLINQKWYTAFSALYLIPRNVLMSSILLFYFLDLCIRLCTYEMYTPIFR